MPLDAATPRSAAAAFPPAAAPAFDARTRRLLEAPIVGTLLQLAAPNILVMLAQAATGLIETFGYRASAPTRWPAWRWCFPAS